MEINRLRSDELTWELAARGCDVGSTVDEKRAQLREAFQRNIREDINIHFEPSSELGICASKLDELVGLIQEFDAENRENEFKKIYSRLMHVKSRLHRVVAEGQDLKSKKQNLMFLLSGCFDALQDANHIASLCQTSVGAMCTQNEFIHPERMDAPVGNLIDLGGAAPDHNPTLERPVDSGLSRSLNNDVDSNLTGNSFGDARRRITEFELQNLAQTINRRACTQLADRLAAFTICPIPFMTEEATSSTRRVSFATNPDSSAVPMIQTCSQSGGNSTSRPNGSISLITNPVSHIGAPSHAGLSNERDVPRSSGSFVPIHKWNVFFNGSGSVTSFIEDIEHLAESRGVTEDQLFHSAYEILRGDARDWYTPRRRSFLDWLDLRQKLRDAFLPLNYDEDLLDDIKRRTQGQDERLLLYVTRMQNLFMKLSSSKPSESEQVNIIRRNLLPHLQVALSFQEIATIESLLERGRAAEEIHWRAQQYCPPPAHPRLVQEPHLAYRHQTANRPVQVRVVETAVQSPRAQPRCDFPRRPIECWNCGQTGHRRFSCPQSRRLLCFRCKQPGYTIRNCPECSKKRDSGELSGRLVSPVNVSTTDNVHTSAFLQKRALIDYVISHSNQDQRPHIEVTVLGHPILGLLDSGSSATLVGKSGYMTLMHLGLKLDTSRKTLCSVANGNTCRSIGSVKTPMSLMGRVSIIDVLVVPELSNNLILGTDFWISMDVVPNLKRNEWRFGEYPMVEVCGITDESTLTEDQRERLNSLVDEKFERMSKGLGYTTVATHEIVLEENVKPIKQRYYPVSPFKQKILDEEVKKMLEMDVIEPSKSAWSSPVLLVPKEDNAYRFCVDYRALNKVTKKDAYPLPYVSSILDRLRGARYLSSMDIKSAFWQVGVKKECREYTAFTVPQRGLFQFKRMPFGLTNAPATWQRLIDAVLGSDLEQYVLVYLDDIIIISPDFETHLIILGKVFDRLMKAGLTLSPGKCKFCMPFLNYLGFVVDSKGLHVDVRKVEAIMTVPPPKNITEIRRFLGMAGWYRRFVPDFSTLIAPLTKLTHKNASFVWDSNCEAAFNHIKNALASAPILTCPDFSKPFVLQTDASAYGLGAVLTQESGDGEKVICFLSRSLTKQERNYSTTERECLGVIWAVEKLRNYLEGSHFTIVTDHASLIWLNNLKDPTGRLARWALRLQPYDFDIVHRKGKDNVVPDFLSRSVLINVEVCLWSCYARLILRGRVRRFRLVVEV
ncbi:uncharacterized protein LOC132707976 [Cylas formicarius]|uniref:uncharacterized protein LOC132707976 n=1 Tax=Cylas formicarius TaxID=197179 RepID=UPI0029585F94|nr:uncharacterized protein LOC132707976 [Cylas formicarius]